MVVCFFLTFWDDGKKTRDVIPKNRGFYLHYDGSSRQEEQQVLGSGRLPKSKGIEPLWVSPIT
jgi:hypothetical protein